MDIINFASWFGINNNYVNGHITKIIFIYIVIDQMVIRNEQHLGSENQIELIFHIKFGRYLRFLKETLEIKLGVESILLPRLGN